MTSDLSAGPATTDQPVVSSFARHATLAVLALAVGGFAIGTGEFATMGLLPNVAAGVHVSIPQAGHIVSAYAVGVMVGAPVIAAVTARVERRKLLSWLMAFFLLANVASALAPNFGLLVVARFAAGLPHGAFFGVGSVVAASLVAPDRRARAVSMILTGLTVANIVGVPLTTFAGQQLSWRWPFALVGLFGLVTLIAVLFWVPSTVVDAGVSARTELSALLQPQIWLTMAIGIVGTGGMFATLSYITPTMTTLGHFAESTVTILLAVYGVGMTTGMIVGGRIADRALMPTLCVAMASSAVVLLLFGYAAHSQPAAFVAVFLLGATGASAVPALQTRLMQVGHEGPSLAAALNHSILNAANAIGAWFGGLVLAHGLGYEWPSRVGGFLAVAGLALALGATWAERRSRTVAPQVA